MNTETRYELFAISLEGMEPITKSAENGNKKAFIIVTCILDTFTKMRIHGSECLCCHGAVEEQGSDFMFVVALPQAEKRPAICGVVCDTCKNKQKTIEERNKIAFDSMNKAVEDHFGIGSVIVEEQIVGHA